MDTKKLFGEREGHQTNQERMSYGVVGKNYLVSYCVGHEVIQTTNRQNLYTPTVALVFCPGVRRPTANRVQTSLITTLLNLLSPSGKHNNSK